MPLTYPEQLARDEAIHMLQVEIKQLLWAHADKALYDAEILRLMAHKDELEKKADAA